MPNHYDNTSRRDPAVYRDTAQTHPQTHITGGKSASSRNPFVPGLRRSIVLMDCEDPAEFEALEHLLRIEFSPRSNTEEMLFTEIVVIHWDQRRCRGIHSALLRIASEDPDTRDGFKHIEGVALAAVSYERCPGQSRALQAVGRDLGRLSRELNRAVRLYLLLHGPLDPPEPPVEPLPSKPESTENTHDSKKIKPIPINEHPHSAFYRPIANDFVRADRPEVVPLTVGVLHG